MLPLRFHSVSASTSGSPESQYSSTICITISLNKIYFCSLQLMFVLELYYYWIMLYPADPHPPEQSSIFLANLQVASLHQESSAQQPPVRDTTMCWQLWSTLGHWPLGLAMAGAVIGPLRLIMEQTTTIVVYQLKHITFYWMILIF
jgi:hypothetical protein